MPNKPSRKLQEVAFGAREALGIEQPKPDIERSVSYTPLGDLAYEMARAKLAGRQLPPPPEGLQLNTQEDVDKYVEFAKKFPELAGKALPKLRDTDATQPASRFRNPQFVEPDQRQEALRKIREQQLPFDPAAELIKRKLGE